MAKILLVIGTRPELIKIAPIVHAFRNVGKDDIIKILSTAQHRDMLEKYWDIFDIRPDYELDFLKKGQSLGELTARAFEQTDSFFSELEKVNKKPEYVVVQGDTTTVFSVGLCSFYHNIKIAHIEAGLRTYDIQNPYPEEVNRRVVSILADINFAPTKISADNLLKEGVPKNKIHIVGNTVVDALQFITKHKVYAHKEFSEKLLNNTNIEKNKVVLITFHRRENQNENLNQLINAINQLSKEYNQLKFIWTLHPNPQIKHFVENSLLSKNKNVILVPPLEYIDIIKLMNLSRIILSDSGGIQEEAPSFGVPVLVLRKTTERPEGIMEKKAFITELKINSIIKQFKSIYHNYYPKDLKNPYGDGFAADKIRDILLSQNNCV